MIDSTEPKLISSADVSRSENIAHGVAKFMVGLSVLVVSAISAIEKVCSEASEAHDRAERLEIYRLRHRWKKSDLANLRTYKLTETAQRRLPKLTGKGRPVVKPHEELFTGLARKLRTALPAVSAEATPSERLRAIKKLRWWPQYVESAYRGEYERAKNQGWSAPAERAERLVGGPLGISQSTVRQLCGNIRARRTADPDTANFPPVTVSRLLAWVEQGRLVNPWEPGEGHGEH